MGRQIMYNGVATKNIQNHERRRPKWGISNEETANPHEDCIPEAGEMTGSQCVAKLMLNLWLKMLLSHSINVSGKMNFDIIL